MQGLSIQPTVERVTLSVRGVVQGVGFRPYVYRLARRHRLSGFVRNGSGSLYIEVEGPPQSVARFREEMAACPLPLAHVEKITCTPLACQGELDFQIVDSFLDTSDCIRISPDVATCDECLGELFNPASRRYRYPFTNCTNCGPRLTIIQSAPYDRQRTTMASFAMCAECRAEYENPLNRRFHAEPICCPNCGPSLALLNGSGERVETPDPIGMFAAAVLQGQIGALKGLGGYHLVCDASSDVAVNELRRRKLRDDKAFAIVVTNLAHADTLCQMNAAERELLSSPQRPIVLLRRRRQRQATGATSVAQAVSPGNALLGVMLPYTPIHHLLMVEVGHRPLVMTSGNRIHEPMTYRDDEVVERLHGIANLFLTHDRPIHLRCDDTVTRIVDLGEYPIRRSRGYAPTPVRLSFSCPTPILAVGGQLKATFALGQGDTATLSHHLGDLDDYHSYRAFEHDVALYEQLVDVRPHLLVHDLHPDYSSTHYARGRAAREGQHTLAVQHHHAHVASCMAENKLTGQVIGVAFDGAGYGTDDAIWGGEFLVSSYDSFARAAHLRYVPLPGGDQAAREPWRSAITHLIDAGCDPTLLDQEVSQSSMRVISEMIARRVNSPQTSSAGRWFDAVAALLGVRHVVSYEGQAAMELEALATSVPVDGSYPFALESCAVGEPSAPFEVDTRPTTRAIVQDLRRGMGASVIARRFHATVAEIVVAACRRIRDSTRLNRVALTGGVFMNVILLQDATVRLTAEGFHVFRHHLVPPNDGGLSLGQLAVAAAKLSQPSKDAADLHCKSKTQAIRYAD